MHHLKTLSRIRFLGQRRALFALFTHLRSTDKHQQTTILPGLHLVIHRAFQVVPKDNI